MNLPRVWKLAEQQWGPDPALAMQEASIRFISMENYSVHCLDWKLTDIANRGLSARKQLAHEAFQHLKSAPWAARETRAGEW